MIPEPTDPRWQRVLMSDAEMSRASLATRILLTRLRSEVRRSPADLATKARELQAFYVKNSFAQADVALF